LLACSTSGCCRAGLLPDTLTFNTLMSAYAKAKDMDGAYDAWCRMREQGLVPNRITVVRHAAGPTLWGCQLCL
jgi:pentatricopeptide repeat protein